MLNPVDLVLLHVDVCLWVIRESHALEFSSIRHGSPMWELAAFSPDAITRLVCSYNERQNMLTVGLSVQAIALPGKAVYKV